MIGATVLEKHFTLARADGGVDSTFSMEPHELDLLVTESERAWQALGKITYGPTKLSLIVYCFVVPLRLSRHFTRRHIYN